MSFKKSLCATDGKQSSGQGEVVTTCFSQGNLSETSDKRGKNGNSKAGIWPKPEMQIACH